MCDASHIMDRITHIRMPARLDYALARVAAQRMQSKSEFVRQELLVALGRYGIDLTAGDVERRSVRGDQNETVCRRTFVPLRRPVGV